MSENRDGAFDLSLKPVSDEVPANRWLANGGRSLWELDHDYETIRSYRIAHNTTTVFEPCHVCGALYYRGPFHIVKRDCGILCHECAGKQPLPLHRLLGPFLRSITHSQNDVRAIKGGHTRILIGVRDVEKCPPEAYEFLEDFRKSFL
jgi:hypothetical protein